jgi:hypothetical protein
MSNGDWTPWKLFAVGMGLVALTAVVTAAVVADWSGPKAVTRGSAPSTARAVAPEPASAPGPRSAAAPTVPTAAVVQACNQYAAAHVGRQDKTTEMVKDGAIGAVVGAVIGAAGGAIADGGKGAGKGAAIGGLVGVGGGTLYGLNESKQHDQRYRDAYAGCMRDRGYRG